MCALQNLGKKKAAVSVKPILTFLGLSTNVQEERWSVKLAAELCCIGILAVYNECKVNRSCIRAAPTLQAEESTKEVQNHKLYG